MGLSERPLVSGRRGICEHYRRSPGASLQALSYLFGMQHVELTHVFHQEHSGLHLVREEIEQSSLVWRQ